MDGVARVTRRADGIIAKALAATTALVDAIPGSKMVHKEQARRTARVCESLVRARPAVEPRTPVITEQGRILYPDFPAEQSLLNRHGPLLRIWREAYRELVTASAPAVKGPVDPLALREEELSTLDHGTRARVVMMGAALRDTLLQLQRANRIIEQQVPAPGQGLETRVADGITDAARVALRVWLEGLEGSGVLVLDASGLRTSTRARPGTVLMPMNVVQVLLAISGKRNEAENGHLGSGILDADQAP